MEENEAEELASIPWDYLAGEARPDIRRWITIGSVAVAVVALTASAARTLWPVSTAAPAVPPPAVVVSTTTSATVVRSLSEADLLGFDLDSARLAAVGHAQWFVHRYMTSDGAGPRSFVESIIPLEAVQVGAHRFSVVMVVRSLRAGEGEAYSRAPDLSVEVVVDVGESGPRVVDWPAPPTEAFTGGIASPVGLASAVPPPDLLEIASAHGAGELIEAATDGMAWRFVFEQIDAAGISRMSSVWLSADGHPIPAGGFQP